MEKKTHWKKANQHKLSWFVGLGRWRKASIDHQGGQRRETKGITSSRGGNVFGGLLTSGKPMVLNKTNAKAIEKATTTPYIEQWVGQDNHRCG